MGAADGAVFARDRARVGDFDIGFLRGGRGDPLVYLHGMGGAGKWESFHMAFANDTLTYAPQLPGWGEWEAPPGISSPGDYAGLVVGLLDAQAIDRVTLAGHSLGAWVALRLAEIQPDRVSRLIVADALGIESPEAPAVQLDALDEEEFGRRLLARLGTIATAQPYGFGAEFTNVRSSAEFERQWKGASLVNKLTRGRYADPDLIANLGRISADTLILWGQKDGLALPAHAEFLHAQIPNSRLVFIEDAGHLPMVERRETFHKLSHDFLLGATERVSGALEA
jgi:pimeloyl-ACP methyl ester carboxylesterase